MNIRSKFDVGDEMFYIKSEPVKETCEHCDNGSRWVKGNPEIVESEVKEIILEGTNGTFSGILLTEPIRVALVDTRGWYVAEGMAFNMREEAEQHLDDEKYWCRW